MMTTSPAGHPGTQRYMPNRLLINPMLLKRAALLKLADFSLLTAEFDGERLSFQPWVSLRTVQRDRIVSLGVYQPAFPSDDADAAGLPDVAWRRAEWDRHRDFQRFGAAPDRAAYLLGDTQIDSRTVFGRLADQPRLATVLRESIATLAAGVSVVGEARPNVEWDNLRVSVVADELALNLDYSPWLAQSEVLESWAVSWTALFDSLDDRGEITPAGDITISYHESFEDLVARVRRFPQPTVDRYLAAGRDPQAEIRSDGV